MTLETHVASDEQLIRLLQIGIVLEEVVEARASRHYQSLSPEEQAELDREIVELLDEAVEESAAHRSELEELIERLEGETVPFEDIERLVEDRYGKTKPEDFDGILYDQLHGEETAYKFYDDLIAAIEESSVTFSIDRAELLETLRSIRAEEEEGAREVTEIMEGRT